MQAILSPAIIRLEAKERPISELDDIEEVVRAHRSRLLRFVTFSLGDADLAESIVQDCFLKAYMARDTFRGDCTLSTWLTGIALNLVRDQQRTQKFRFWRKFRGTVADVTELACHLPSQASSPEAQLLAREKALQVGSILDRLSLNQRTIFLMRFQEEMDLREIAAATNMNANTVKTHLHRAVKAVREGLAQ